jgi:hypothetical protein
MTGSLGKLITAYKSKLNNKFPLTDLSDISWLLSIKVTCDRAVHTISLSQSSYIDTILSHFSLSNAKSYPTPMVPSAFYFKHNAPLSSSNVVCMHKVPYCKAIGSLMYAAIATCPDIAFSVSVLPRFLENLGEAHWKVVKHIFCYLARMHDHMLTYGAEQHDLMRYTDADGASQEHHCTISSYAFLIDRGVVSWSSCKQELVTLLTTEAEYIMAMHTAKECIWLCCLIGKLFPSLIRQTTC